jgi:UDP-N-acetylglucosamine transferase subunit ALG13
MIFVTVGTTQFPFHRMVDVVKKLVKTRKNHETIIFQHGNTGCDIHEKNVVLKRYLSYPEVQRYIKQARIIITHGGPATIYQVLAAGKIPYVLPRKKLYKEHVNDHQVAFYQELKKQGRIVMLDETTKTPHFQTTQYTKKPTENSSLHRLVQYLTIKSTDL